MIQKIPLGNTDAMVSELSLGAMYFGSKMDEKASTEVLESYVGHGGSFIDTANIYARWIEGCNGLESEAFLGRWFQKTGKRAEMFVATKVGFDNVEVGFGLGREQIIKSCEASLQLMKTDYIDLMYAHTDDRETPLEETMEAFAQLHRAGKVRYLGASNYVPWRLEKAKAICQREGWPQYACMQQRLTYLRPVPVPLDRYHTEVSDDVMDYAEVENLTILAYSPLMGGYYNHQKERPVPELYDGDFNRKRLQALNEVVKEIEGITPNQLVLAWMRQQAAPVIPLISGSRKAQLEENIKCLDYRLSAEQLDKLNNA